MIKRFKEYASYLVGGFFLTGISLEFNFAFLEIYLWKNLINLIILLVFNIVMNGIIINNLKELTELIIKSTIKIPNFESTIKEIKISIHEQFVLIVVTLLLIILSNYNFHIYIDFIINGLITSIFIAGLYTLYDIINSVIMISKFESNFKTKHQI